VAISHMTAENRFCFMIFQSAYHKPNIRGCEAQARTVVQDGCVITSGVLKCISKDGHAVEGTLFVNPGDESNNS
jgi:hypothetical protein